MTGFLEPGSTTWRGADKVYALLAGSWRFHRIVEAAASMKGEAIFLPSDGERMLYREQGQLRLKTGEEFGANREYWYEPRPNGFAAFFVERPPRLFHDVILSATDSILTGEAVHLCAPDRYLSRYQFLPDGSFIIRHHVEGPRKNYTITTQYTRQTLPSKTCP